MDERYHPIPQPEEISTRERQDAMGAYLMMFASLGVGLPLPLINLLAAVIYYFVNRKKSRFIHFHTLQSLISQLPTSLLNAGAVFWTFSILTSSGVTENVGEDFDPVFNFTDLYFGYIIMVVIANLVYIIFSLIAAVRAYNGRFYYMLFFGRLAYHYAYSKQSTIGEETVYTNRPPM
ncbi:MAG: DUF4870 domain-containing protein [Bacteroidetes bacterium]|nr:MAG: DUF4870 domain-containing protein [Bacteroidota bacterium]